MGVSARQMKEVAKQKIKDLEAYSMTQNYDIIAHIKEVDNRLKEIYYLGYYLTNSMKIYLLLKTLPKPWNQAVTEILQNHPFAFYKTVIRLLRITWCREVMRNAGRTNILSMNTSLKRTQFLKGKTAQGYPWLNQVVRRVVNNVIWRNS